MVTLFVFIVSIYCIAGIMVHLYYSLSTVEKKKEKHYVLYTETDFDIMEWYYRCFKRFSKTMGVNVSITVVGSEASTSFNQISRWQKSENIIRYVSVYDSSSESDIHIRLDNENDLHKLPF